MRPYEINSQNEDQKILKPSRRKLSNSLLDTEISEDFFRTSKDSIKLVGAMKDFNHSSHSGASNATSWNKEKRLTSKDLNSRVSNLVSSASALELDERQRSSEFSSLFHVGVMVHLIWLLNQNTGNMIDPLSVCFAQADHFSQLLADDWLGDERFSKDFSLICPLETFFDHSASSSV